MPRVAALYRYPVKGFTPEPVEHLTVLPGGRAAGDRVLNFRFADAPVADTAWCRKYHGVVLANTPGLARLNVGFDERGQQLTICAENRVLADASLDEAGRRRLADAITGYVLSLDDNPLRGQPGRLPLKLVGDGTTPNYQDNEAGQVTLQSRESLVSAGAALGDAHLDGLRFRHNIVIDGVAAWEEQSWVGGRLRVGDVAFEAVAPKVRCLATHANPVTGEHELQVMQLLMKMFAQKEPTFGIGLLWWPVARFGWGMRSLRRKFSATEDPARPLGARAGRRPRKFAGIRPRAVQVLPSHPGVTADATQAQAAHPDGRRRRIRRVGRPPDGGAACGVPAHADGRRGDRALREKVKRAFITYAWVLDPTASWSASSRCATCCSRRSHKLARCDAAIGVLARRRRCRARRDEAHARQALSRLSGHRRRRGLLGTVRGRSTVRGAGGRADRAGRHAWSASTTRSASPRRGRAA